MKKIEELRLTEDELKLAMAGKHILEEANKLCSKLLSINEELVTLAQQKSRMLAQISKNGFRAALTDTPNGNKTS